MLECVINVSNGSDAVIISKISDAAKTSLVDVHSDAYHNRSVFTLLGPRVYEDALALTFKAFELLDIRQHIGVHPRIGVVDVVPFVPVGNTPMLDAVKLRNQYSRHIAEAFGVPIFTYGENRTLPMIRKDAFTAISPDYGPQVPHERFGAIAVGARPVLVAYNLYLNSSDISKAKKIAKEVRSEHFRTLALQVGEQVQLSANLVDPLNHGIFEFYSLVKHRAEVKHGELVGLAPLSVIENVPKTLWSLLDLSTNKSLETHIPR